MDPVSGGDGGTEGTGLPRAVALLLQVWHVTRIRAELKEVGEGTLTLKINEEIKHYFQQVDQARENGRTFGVKKILVVGSVAFFKWVVVIGV